MLSAGIDLSSQDRDTAISVMSWRDGAGRVVCLRRGVGDAELLRVIGAVDKVGIDVPFGWPIAYVDALHALDSGAGWPSRYLHAETLAYRYRRTDLHVWRTPPKGPPPLSVSTDRIGIPAMRAAALLAKTDHTVDRSGSGIAVEVYPAAALRSWALPARGYKGRANLGALGDLVSRFRKAAPWLEMAPEDDALCRLSDDVFDAVIAASVARAAWLGRVHPVPPEELDAARREGWIALPLTGSLPLLATSAQFAPPSPRRPAGLGPPPRRT